VNTIKSKVAAAIAVVRTIKSKVIGALAGAGGWLISAGRAIIQGLLNGINSMIGSVGSALGRLTAYIKSHKGPPEKDAVLLVESGRLIMKSLIKGFQAGEGEVKSYLGGLTGAMPAMAQGGASYQTTSSFSPTIHVHVQAGLDPVDAAARRALVKGLWLETEKFRKDYVR
jgi:phage-related protein